MIERNFTQFLSSFWLIRLPVNSSVSLEPKTTLQTSMKQANGLTGAVDGDFNVGTGKDQRRNKEADGNGFSKTTWCRYSGNVFQAQRQRLHMNGKPRQQVKYLQNLLVDV
jgi:hypothetical protein